MPPGTHTWKSSLRDSISTCSTLARIESLRLDFKSSHFPSVCPWSLLPSVCWLGCQVCPAWVCQNWKHFLSLTCYLNNSQSEPIFSLSHASLLTLSHTFLSATLIVLSAILIVLSQQLSYFSHRTSYYS